MQSDVEQKRLRLNEFKALFKALKTNTPWVDHLLLGVLVWIEEELINNRVRVELDEAIKEWETLQPPNIQLPVYTESPSETSTRLPEMRITAPWYIDRVGERSEP